MAEANTTLQKEDDHAESDATQPTTFGEVSDIDADDEPIACTDAELDAMRSVIDESSPSAADDEPIVYTDEELDAMRQIRTSLLEEHGIPSSRVGSAFLAVATINCKLRVDETVTKIKKLLEIMEKLGCPDGIDDDLWKPEAAYELRPYPPVGVDRRGCRTTWIIGGGKVKKEDERAHCHACIMQYLSVHSDPKTLRKGISFIIDLAGRKDMTKEKKRGNEKLIQSFYQAMPQRPQIIMIAGCSLPTRAFVNVSIKLASLFIKQKLLQRILFVTVKQAAGSLAEGSAPVYVGGKGGGIDNYEAWVKERLQKLPKPEL